MTTSDPQTAPRAARRFKPNQPAPEPRAAARPSLLSIVVPAFNEEESLADFHRAVRRAMRDLGQPFEVVFVNDGSRDGTLAMMKALRERHPNTTIVDLSRNFGKEIALTAGLDHATGDAVVVMDADLQHPPEVIADFIAGWREGYDVVYGVRRTRRDEGLLKKAATRAFYRFMQATGATPLEPDAGDFRLLSRKAVDAVTHLRERHRFMKAVFSWIGYPSLAVPFDVAPRAQGKSKFNFWRLWNFSIEGVTSHTLVPLKASTYLGFAVACFAFLNGAYFIAKTILFGDTAPGFPTLIVVILFLGGIQLMVLGVIGEYLGRVFNETKNRPLYLVNDVMARSGGEEASASSLAPRGSVSPARNSLAGEGFEDEWRVA